MFYFFIIIITQINLILNQEENVCERAATCGECITIPRCAWCKAEYTAEDQTPRCRTEDILKESCSGKYETVKTEIDENPFRMEEDLNIITLASTSAQLRIGDEVTFDMKIELKTKQRWNLYLLVDVSDSIQQHAKKITDSMLKLYSKLTGNKAKIGVGYYVDIPLVPYVSGNNRNGIASAYLFKSHLSLTNNQEDIRKALEHLPHVDSVDAPEAPLSAISEVLACQNIIGWDTDADVKRIILVVSERYIKFENDARIVGNLPPHNGECLTETGNQKEFAYPSIISVYDKLKSKDTHILFLVSQAYISYYQKITDGWDSNTLLAIQSINTDTEVIFKALEEASSKQTEHIYVRIKESETNKNLRMHLKVKCHDDSDYVDGSECTNVNHGKSVKFKLSVTANKCLTSDNSTTIELVVNQKHTVPIVISTKCECPCEISGKLADNSIKCSSSGKDICGICKCNENIEGKYCQCNANNLELKNKCLLNQEVCSNQGTCECGKCICNVHSSLKPYGDHCECSDFSCSTILGRMCSGNGICKCHSCECNGGYEGRDCDRKQCSHSVWNQLCVKDNIVCSEKGRCDCGKCTCNVGYEGEFCTTRKMPTISCKDAEPCLLRHLGVSNSGVTEPNCNFKVNTVGKITTPESPFSPHCTYLGSDGCRIFYSPAIESDNSITEMFIKSRSLEDCPKSKKILPIILGVIGGVLLVGILLVIGLFSAYHYLFEKRQFKKLLKESQNSQWVDNQNPLYAPAVTSVENPRFRNKQSSVAESSVSR